MKKTSIPAGLQFSIEQQEQIEVDCNNFMGYPRNIGIYQTNQQLIDAVEGKHIMNIGDPYAPGKIMISSYQQERGVVEYYAGLFGLKADETRGYIGSSGTLGNLQGLKMAKHKYPQGHVFYSHDTHYSIENGATMMGLTQHHIVSQLHGEINYDDLTESLQRYKTRCEGKGIPCQPIIMLTLGTTVKGAIDQPTLVLDILKKLEIDQHYIHIDGALAGGFWPFVQDNQKPHIGFDINIDSISISGHKFIGSKDPAGIFICRKSLRDAMCSNSEYIGTNDITVSGSRNGRSPIYLGQSIIDRHNQFGTEISKCFEKADYLVESIKKTAPHYSPWKNPYSTTVVFSRPSDRIVKKYSLACQGDIAHVVIMQHISQELIDQFVEDLTNDNSSNTK